MSNHPKEQREHDPHSQEKSTYGKLRNITRQSFKPCNYISKISKIKGNEKASI